MSLHFSLSEQALMWVYLFYIQSKRSLLDNFISNETSQVGWAKIEEKNQKKHMAHPQAELGLSNICPLWDPNCNSVFMLNIHHFKIHCYNCHL